jgi:hypothetical protein
MDLKVFEPSIVAGRVRDGTFVPLDFDDYSGLVKSLGRFAG